jgi:uncharacterized protein (TIGR03066 family)
MNAVRMLAVGAVVCLVATLAGADEKKGDYAKLIVGKWEVTKADAGTVGPGAVVEFTKDGKMKVTGGDMTIEGEYKLTGETMKISFKAGDQDKSHDLTLKKLDDKTLIVADPEGKSVELARKK